MYSFDINWILITYKPYIMLRCFHIFNKFDSLHRIWMVWTNFHTNVSLEKLPVLETLSWHMVSLILFLFLWYITMQYIKILTSPDNTVHIVTTFSEIFFWRKYAFLMFNVSCAIHLAIISKRDSTSCTVLKFSKIIIYSILNLIIFFVLFTIIHICYLFY